MGRKGVIFDFNGTLFFDSEFHALAWEEICQELTGHGLNDYFKDFIYGKHTSAIIREMKATLDEKEILKYSLKKEEIYRKICMSHPNQLHLVKGVISCFETLQQADIPFTIASASIKENIDFFIQVFQLERWFYKDKIIYDNGCYRNKVEMFKDACRELGLHPKDTVVIEDSQTGIKNAKEVGIGCIIGIGSKSSHNLLKQYGANYCIEDYMNLDILDFLA